VNCFAGACGLNYPLGVERFRDSPFCYSCDEASAATVSGTGGFRICTMSEASAPLPPSMQSSVQGGLAASPQAVQAAQAAGGSLQGEAGPSEEEQIATAQKIAAQVRAAQALQAVQASKVAWETARTKYEQALAVFRRAELGLGEAKVVMQTAAAMEKQAKLAYSVAAIESTKAAQKAEEVSREDVEKSIGAAGGAGGGAGGAGCAGGAGAGAGAGDAGGGQQGGGLAVGGAGSDGLGGGVAQRGAVGNQPSGDSAEKVLGTAQSKYRELLKEQGAIFKSLEEAKKATEEARLAAEAAGSRAAGAR